MVENAYIHIPFCKSKCKYCSFVSFPNLDYIESYFDALTKDITSNYNEELLKTIYFGGGTPSLISVDKIEKILKLLNFNPNTEITFEINPDDTTEEYLKNLKRIGINRLSIGSQSFDDNILKLIGRRHNSENTISTVKLAQDTGFENINLDLIYGLPTQTIQGIEKDINTIVNLGIQHISTYGLKIDKGSYFYKNRPQELPDDDTQADMYLRINELLTKYNFNRYEISNFSKKGFESKHNLNYWNNSEYYGFGLAAHGYKNVVRYSNYTTLDKYINNPAKPKCSNALTLSQKLEEEIFLGFRKTEGVNILNINNQYNIDFEEKYKTILNKYTPEYIKKTPNGYSLTTKGVLLSNIILSEFLD